MSQLFKKLASGYHHLFYELADPRVEPFFLMSSPIPVAIIVAFYIYFVFKLGPRLMKNRPPFDLEKVLIIYNIVQIILCGYLVIQFVRHLLFTYSFICEPISYSTDEMSIFVARHVWLYFIIKVIDLLDTVFFVLRKKNNQISFLHVYHHTGMVLLGWAGTKYIAGGHGVFVGFLNSIVHVVMYFYYLLSAWNKEYKKSLWWKKYLTQMQIVQFFIMILYFGQLLFQPNCTYPKWTVWVFVPQNVFMIVLFLDFYIKSYVKPKKNHEMSSMLAREAAKTTDLSKFD
ncbi:elongation of very long chain fatty acids protein 7-like [Agrilus planipennis]|uniref:Elongation of very long chain fatty acids protein n=1 Tax=Agrilus planipennis TaxID=224129 RepID=A0A1W4X4I0_AGRPL|nr:elongation of very long chain fatty acids protein 7-like [Agrilus planipennis]